jgi:transposase InsO family protein
MAGKLYFDRKHPTGFSTLNRLHAAARGRTAGELREWIEAQDIYTIHRPVRKRFPRNPYTVTNIMDVWECVLVDVQGLSKHNDGIKYLLSVIDVFSKQLHVVPLKSKTGPSVTAVFQSILKDRRYSKPVRRRQVWLQTDRGKEFSNRSFQDMLKREGTQFLMCRNPDVKCAVVKRAHRTLRNKLYRYFTYKNTYRFVCVATVCKSVQQLCKYGAWDGSGRCD